MKVSIVLPTYNEKDNILSLIKLIEQNLRSKLSNYEILVIDDNSPDKTGYICKKKYKVNKKIKVFIKKTDKGLGSSILYGLKRAKNDYIVVMDTDFSHNPNLIPKMLSKIKNFDIVISSRYSKFGGGENKTRFFLSKMFNLYLRSILRINISDFLFGFFCIRRRFLVENKLLSNNIFFGFGDYFIRLAFYINKHEGRFAEIPAFYKDRVNGKSKSNILKMFITYTYTSLKLFLKGLSK